MTDIEAVARAIVSDPHRIHMSLSMDLAWAVIDALQTSVKSGELAEPMQSRLVDLAWTLQSQIELRHPDAAQILDGGWQYDVDLRS